MNIKRAKEEIKDAIQAYFYKNEYGEYEIPPVRQRPILLLGAPGIGKTQIMEQIARECKVGLVSYTITHHTRQSAIGLPYISQEEFDGKTCPVTEYTMSEIVASVYEKIRKTGIREGILFIDEINCVSETLAPAMLQFLQCKTFGNHEIPQGWLIAAAGNPPEYNKSVREFDVVTMDRVKKIEVEPDYEAWKEYACQQEIHPAILSYLSLRPSYFYQMESTVDGKQFATPRGWEDLSRMIYVYEKLGKTVDRDVVIQYIQHEKIAKDFAGYLELSYKYREDYQIDAVFEGKIPEGMVKRLSHASFDERLSVTGLILSRCNTQFSAWYRECRRLERLLECLKQCREGLLGAYQDAPMEFLEDCRDSFEGEFRRLKNAELLDREEEHLYLDTLSSLEEIIQKIKGAAAADGREAFSIMQELFADRRAQYDQIYDRVADTLEKAFDFMEAALPQGQEMVIFITELNTGCYAVKFLEEYECPRYYLYNRNLLFQEKRQELIKQMDEL